MCIIRSGCRRCHKSFCGLPGGRSLHVHILHTCTFLWSATASGHSLRALQTQVFTGCSLTYTSVQHTAANQYQPQVTSGMNPNNDFTVILRNSPSSVVVPLYITNKRFWTSLKLQAVFIKAYYLWFNRYVNRELTFLVLDWFLLTFTFYFLVI